MAVHGGIAARRVRETDPAAPEEIKRLQEELWRMGRVGALMELFMGLGLVAIGAADVSGRFGLWTTAGILAGFGAIGTVQFVRVGRARKILRQSEGRRFVERLKGDEDATPDQGTPR